MTEHNILYMIVPCYNEEAVLGETSKRLREKYDALIGAGLISPDSRVVFVNDGSKDRTWEIISALHDEAPEYFSGINLAHNAGHQKAVLAGLMTVKDLCDMAITMDADSPVSVAAADERTLAGAYRHAMRRWFPPSGRAPDPRFFTSPQP